MEREIKFRGKILAGDWVYGLLANKMQLWYISNAGGSPFAFGVRPETIGQYTGAKDDLLQDIYEGDIMRIEYVDDRRPSVVVTVRYSKWHTCFSAYGDTEFGKDQSFSLGFSGSAVKSFNVIGNVHDNPELLDGHTSKDVLERLKGV